MRADPRPHAGRCCPSRRGTRGSTPRTTTSTRCTKLLVPLPADELESWPVSTLVNKADNNGPELLDRVAGSLAVASMELRRVLRRDPARRRTRSAAAARAAGVDAPVPSCPEWTVADLLGHVGRMHRWVTRDRRVERRPTRPTHWSDAEPPPPDGALDWFDAGVDLVADALLARRSGEPSVVVDRRSHRRVLGAAPGERDRGAPLGRAARGRRRRADRARARGRRHRRVLRPHPVLARAADACAARGETIHLHCTDGDGEWLVRLARRRRRSSRASTRRATSRRAAPRPTCCCSSTDGSRRSTLEVFGDASLLDALAASSSAGRPATCRARPRCAARR